ncbi:phosphoserine phosphatase activity [Scheffersomyces stipitis CBS 6054]|uniref:phosphoserine phosphatase n=1 Tax=Scheffersomyces stipitis (strain ATCC 58785 / CBS 6054 / NBRC 10063 / NRRL Y-11545) TaxID=322104 RepID=A3LND7_PICST|nr:phosphoserine phosphatase activity [Scheffersomyces stipitis CBS 6054]ABN64838.2 phosphoserine phosphatase activity [Scheffersomyces stipitis CBS 6054]
MSEEYALTVIAHGCELSAEDLTAVKTLLTDVLKVGKFTSQDLSTRAVDFYFQSAKPEELQSAVKNELLNNSNHYDLVFQKQSTRKSKKLFIFDMDSTLIYQEVIELIAAYANIEDKVAEITERAMNGELDFNASLAERVSLLKGIDATSIWEELKHKIEVTNGAKELCLALKKLNVVMGVCSGGFIPLAEHVKLHLGLDYAYANVLGTNEKLELDGTTTGPIVNGEMKAELLLKIAKNHGIDPQDAVAVGDGANDLKMMSVAGFGVAWNAKPKVQQLAPSCLNSDSLLDILYILGYTEAEIKELVN